MKTAFSLLAATTLACVTVGAQEWSVTSPNSQIKLSVRLNERAGAPPHAAGPVLTYRVEQGAVESRVVVVGDSPLGLGLRGQDFASGLRFDSARLVKPLEEAYEMPHGKRRQCRNRGNELTLVFRNAAGLPLELDFRAYDDGVAFRYRLPLGGSGGGDGGTAEMEREWTGFAVPAGAKLWMAPSDKATTYSPAYETYYENGISSDTPAPLGLGWSFPALFQTPEGRWGLITEADVGTNYCGTRLSSRATNGVYFIEWPNPAEGNGTGAVRPVSRLPWEMPWRVIVVGASLGTVVESTLVQDVCPPSRLQDASWVRPGRVAWSWWSDNPSPQDGAKQKKFVDLAAEMGWEYVLVDANWDIMDNGNVHEVIRHAKAKGIGVLLWYNSGGPHNVVTEKPRDTLTYAPVRRHELELLRKWGVKGIKVDFFQSDKQNVIGLYHDILRDAAEYQIMVNFHGCTLPRGWERSWPHLMAMEAVRGEECYIFDSRYPEMAPGQNTITPFTRNAVGPMDYTPTAFSNHNHPHRTTAAHELALAVLFESGWVHFADKAEAYLGLPAEPKDFLKRVPVAWDDTRFVAGYPGQFVILARRKGDTWYLAGVNGQGQEREEQVKPGAWLGAGSYELSRIGDGADARSFDSKTQRLEAGQSFAVKMLPYGGFVATLKPAR
ncbi:MAG TPA: glycoside hydrolase family 97 catalytic domain-containing protein [Candidatus Paceibacterota bacterium]|nr:glycoside hydrolase family 97 catalytic domain-containing protein [Candidatus Paceibacterota bacterium]